MKRVSLAIALIASFSVNVNAQWSNSGSDITTSSGVNNVYVPNKLGVGLTTGSSLGDQLTVSGNISLQPTGSPLTNFIRGNNGDAFNLCANTSTSDGSYISMNGNAATTNPGLVSFNSYVSGSNDRFDFNLVTSGSSTQTAMAIDANGFIALKPNDPTASKSIYGGCSSGINNVMEVAANTSILDGSSLMMYGNSTSNVFSGEVLLSSYNPANIAFSWNITNYVSGFGPMITPYMMMTSTGKVVIGGDLYSALSGPTFNLGANPNDYNLFVSKGILTEKVKVALSTTTDWSDYVFNEDYKLMPLSNVASYVTEHKHLPDVPSATEVKDAGIDVAKMDAKLLQKIEELTLYAIQQQKEIDELKKELHKEERKN